MKLFSRIPKEAQELIKTSRLSKLYELGKNLVSEELVEKLHNNNNQRREIVAEATISHRSTSVTTNQVA
jgi:hypothetical protein